MIIFTTIIILIIIIYAIIYLSETKPETKSRPESEIQGNIGEMVVAKILGNNIEDVQYVINNLLFVNEYGKSCQIDHVFINKSGIWVIETKNYAGYIYGNNDQPEWMQVLAYGKKKIKFYSPVKQNKAHIYYLTKFLNVTNIFQNVVVFLNRANIQNVTSDNVYSIYNLNTIKTANTGICLSVKAMKYYYRKLLELKNYTNVNEKIHVKNVHIMKKELQEGICPRCGGNLVVKNGKYGQFYGCSNYPKCKFTINKLLENSYEKINRENDIF